MQVVKPEWAATQAHFTTLAMGVRVTYIISELEALQSQLKPDRPSVSDTPLELSPGGAIPISLSLRLRTIQRYVEWTVPELLPNQAEEAETLVNVARLAAHLLIQENEWNLSGVVSEIDLWLKHLKR